MIYNYALVGCIKNKVMLCPHDTDIAAYTMNLRQDESTANTVLFPYKLDSVLTRQH